MCKSRSSLYFSVVTAISMLSTAGVARVMRAQDETPAPVVAAFPASSALEQGVSPEALGRLAELVQSFVEDGDVVGAELMVIKSGRTILHAGYGVKNREQDVPMGTGNVFCVRSMTKPLIGTSILMLADDKQLKLSDPVSKYLPAFSGEGQKGITIENLLMHTSGLPLSLIMSADLHALEGIGAVAQLGAECELGFEPGSAFNYSDQGTDTLTAVIEVVSGMSAAEFVRARVLDPLGMQHSTCVMDEENPLRELACCKYSGSRGAWNPFWCPDDAALFPFFLGSQGLYSTLEDYACFMELWLHRGRSSEERLLGARYVRKALVPNEFPFPGSTGLAGLEPSYGFLMQLWTELDDAGKRDVVAFGHSGSDGTYAWVFPEHDAIVLYFTQSRGNATGSRVEEALSEVFLGAAFDPNQAAPPFDEYLGYYAEDEFHRYQAVIRDGDSLALETPGRRIRQLIYAGGDRWKFRAKPNVVLEFQRAAGDAVTSFRLWDGDHELDEEFRFEPSAELPPAEVIAARVAATHRIDLLESLGPLRTRGGLRIEKLDITGEESTLLAWPDRFRVDSAARGQSERVAFDGTRVWNSTGDEPVEELVGPLADAVRQQNSLALFGDWSARYTRLEVIQRIEANEMDLVLVRVGDTSAPAMTLYVDWNSGRLVRMETVSVIKGMGRIGAQTTFEDFRDVSGMLLPFRASARLANNMIGTIVSTTEEVELGVELPDDVFELRD